MPTYLPAPLTSLLGREHEIRTLSQLLRASEVRLVTITGPGGVIESPNRLLLDSLKEFLRERQGLLLLDNFEQIMSAAPVLSELYLLQCRSITTLR